MDVFGHPFFMLTIKKSQFMLTYKNADKRRSYAMEKL